jgi:hypothetical protein
MGQVKGAGDPKYQGKAQGNQGVERAQGDPGYNNSGPHERYFL